ncbi:effector-associated domain EAD1-containing protein [Kitasatospora sp. NPDC050543]|uniref:effector-associated domain EAD1-containing protein n=1 Tax=Kitasatospora sp. NPDC050543 TaxID=3364054 RepID=UPI0037B03624
MKLCGPDQRTLVQAVAAAFRPDELQQELRFIEHPMDQITLAPTFLLRIGDVVDEANRAGWVEELLTMLRASNYPAVRSVAVRLLERSREPTGGGGDPFLSNLVGQRLFLDRELLRSHLKDLVSDSRSRVLVVTGPRSCGKSYTWYFVADIAEQLKSFRPVLIDLGEWADQICTPLDLMGAIAFELKLPEPTVDQHAQGAGQARRLRDWLVGQLYDQTTGAEYVLVVDSLDQVPLRQDTAELIEHLAGAAIRHRLPGLRVILIGYQRLELHTLDSVLTEPIGEIDRPVLCDFFHRLAEEVGVDLGTYVVGLVVDQLLQELPQEPALALRSLPERVRATANAVFEREVLP